jgi:ubiquinone/menaquinone biosynthesis C-methylase UbiE
VPLADLRASLGDVARLNALFGGRRITRAHLAQLLADLPAGRPVTVVDVGTGSADIPRALVRWARRAGRRLRVIAIDRDAATLGVARAACAGYPEIAFVQGDALALPVAPSGVDVVISALVLHHLEPGPAARALGEMDAAARRGVIVNDLARSRAGWWVVWLATRLFARSPLSRHDGPLSVRRAYTPSEVAALCAQAGLGDVQVAAYPLLVRQCAVRVKW